MKRGLDEFVPCKHKFTNVCEFAASKALRRINFKRDITFSGVVEYGNAYPTTPFEIYVKKSKKI